MTGWLTDTAAAVTLLIALVLLVRGPVMRHFGPGLAYALWALPLARALMPGITLTVEAPAEQLAALPLPAGTAAMVAAPPTADWTLLLLCLWLAGALVLGAHAMIAYVRLRRAITRDVSLIDIVDDVAIVESGAVDSPVAVGLIKRLVVLPRDFRATFTPRQQHQVIAHELEHHRGRDLLFNLAAFALLALNWFNPIAWAGWRAFRQDQEAACDARTLARTGGDRASYGRTIAAAAAGSAIRPNPALTLAMGEKSALIHRLRSLTMTSISPRRRWTGRAAVIGAALLALPATATVSYVVQDPPAPPAAPTPPEAPTAPEAPLPPLPPEIDMTAGPGEHVRRIERDGRTIILRTNRELSDAEAERMVAEAETSASTADRDANAANRRQVRQIIVRSHNSDAAAPAPPVPPAPPGAAVRGESTFVFRHDGVAADGDIRTSCDDDPQADRIERTTGEGNGQHTLRIIRCGGGNEPAIRLSALRSARQSLAAMRSEHLPAEARRSALAELDQLISQMEREAGN